MHGKDPMVVLKTEYSRGGRNSATVRMKLKSLIANFNTEVVFKADDKIDQVILDKKDCTYSYFADPMYVCMDAEYNQYEVEAENMGDSLNYLEDGMERRSGVLRRQGHFGRTAHQRRSAKSPGPSPPSRATPPARCSSPPRSPPALKSACRFLWPRATRSKSTPAPANTASASKQRLPAHGFAQKGSLGSLFYFRQGSVTVLMMSAHRIFLTLLTRALRESGLHALTTAHGTNTRPLRRPPGRCLGRTARPFHRQHAAAARCQPAGLCRPGVSAAARNPRHPLPA